MSEKAGTKETMEMLQLVVTLTGLLAREIKGDGLQWTDVLKIVTSPEFQGKLAEAVSGFKEIPGEIQDLSGFEAIDLAEFALKATKSVLQSLGKAA